MKSRHVRQHGRRRTRSAGIISETGVQQWTMPINTLPYLTWNQNGNDAVQRRFEIEKRRKLEKKASQRPSVLLQLAIHTQVLFPSITYLFFTVQKRQSGSPNIDDLTSFMLPMGFRSTICSDVIFVDQLILASRLVRFFVASVIFDFN